MNRHFATVCVSAILLAACQVAPKAAIETGVLNDQPGHIGNVIGAEVAKTYTSADGEHRVVDVLVPAQHVNGNAIEVIGPDTTDKKRGARVELLNDYKGDKVGVRVRIPNNNSVTFRLRFVDPGESE